MWVKHTQAWRCKTIRCYKITSAFSVIHATLLQENDLEVNKQTIWPFGKKHKCSIDYLSINYSINQLLLINLTLIFGGVKTLHFNLISVSLSKYSSLESLSKHLACYRDEPYVVTVVMCRCHVPGRRWRTLLSWGCCIEPRHPGLLWSSLHPSYQPGGYSTILLQSTHTYTHTQSKFTTSSTRYIKTACLLKP